MRDYLRVKEVGSIRELFKPFGDAHVILYRRDFSENLRGQFNALARRLRAPVGERGSNVKEFEADLRNIATGPETSGIREAALLLLRDRQDVDLILNGKTRPSQIRVENNGGWKEEDEEKFHIDHCVNTDVGRVIACYTDPVTQWIRWEDALRKEEGVFSARPGAQISSFRVGDIFRFKALSANDESTAGQESCLIHRRPEPTPQQRAENVPRLLWVAG